MAKRRHHQPESLQDQLVKKFNHVNNQTQESKMNESKNTSTNASPEMQGLQKFLEEELKSVEEATKNALDGISEEIGKAASKLAEDLAQSQSEFQKKIEERLGEFSKQTFDYASMQSDIEDLKKRCADAEAAATDAKASPPKEPTFADKSLEVAKVLSTPLMIAGFGLAAYSAYKQFKG